VDTWDDFWVLEVEVSIWPAKQEGVGLEEERKMRVERGCKFRYMRDGVGHQGGATTFQD
jgi:hypothetical protein